MRCLVVYVYIEICDVLSGLWKYMSWGKGGGSRGFIEVIELCKLLKC